MPARELRRLAYGIGATLGIEAFVRHVLRETRVTG